MIWGNGDVGHVAHGHTAEFQRRADVEPLHRLVEVRDGIERLAREALRPEPEQQADHRTDAGDDEEAELPVVGGADCHSRHAAMAWRLKNATTRASSLWSRSSTGLPLA